MHESNDKNFQELNWRRRLSVSELAELQKLLEGRPGEARQWQAEEALSRALEQLPPAPVSSNFTARVVAAARRGEAQTGATRALDAAWFFRGWWPRLAAGAVMVGVGFLSFREFHATQVASRARAEESLGVAARLADLPPVEWLNNFDTIQRLDKVKVADDELLSALE